MEVMLLLPDKNLKITLLFDIIVQTNSDICISDNHIISFIA